MWTYHQEQRTFWRLQWRKKPIAKVYLHGRWSFLEDWQLVYSWQIKCSSLWSRLRQATVHSLKVTVFNCLVFCNSGNCSNWKSKWKFLANHFELRRLGGQQISFSRRFIKSTNNLDHPALLIIMPDNLVFLLKMKYETQTQLS